ncbi:RDD family protein [Amphibacillus jilinensis]|uniref:RDD family protein n=1 Tax=Amphibacillus jilinensis TaxID=1216008 RepID=UPI000319B074|nr:RDD family protein [Amphibacillus jilinensis]
MLEQSQIKTPEYVSINFSIAGIGSRAAAFLIDSLIIGLFNVVIFILALISLDSILYLLFYNPDSLWILAWVVLLIFVINWSYFFLFEYFYNGKTIGKRLIGIRVIQDNGHRLTLLSSFIRNFLRVIDDLPGGYFIGIVMIFFHSKHKRLGDLVAGTIVVHDKGRNKKKKRSQGVSSDKRNSQQDDIAFDSILINQLTERDYQLVKTYCQRYPDLPKHEKASLTRQVGEIILPKVNLDQHLNNLAEVDNILHQLYSRLKEEWSY